MRAGRPVVVGIDLLDLSRVPAAGPLASRILGPGEHAVLAEGPHAVYPYLALKEAIVKAAGGRPPGFRWQGAEIFAETAPGDRPSVLTEIMVSAAAALGSAAAPVFVECRLGPALDDWAAGRLGPGPDAVLRCWGAWVPTADDELFAAVVVEAVPRE